jgi:hypothetical protein
MVVPDPRDDAFVARVQLELAQARRRCAEILADVPRRDEATI